MTDTVFRIHPTINFARVGTSEDYYIAPETAAGEAIGPDGLFGGLPIKAGTEDTPIEASDLRDSAQKVKRQAARFRIYAYDGPQTQYPGGGGAEIQPGSTVSGKKVKDIVWTVHVANKKANNYEISSANGKEEGINAYKDGKTPPVRNKDFGPELALPKRLRELVIDPGPRTIASSATATIPFSRASVPTYADAKGTVHTLPDYPVSFPDDFFTMFNAQGPIDTLGAMKIEPGTGRLIILGGYGRASGIETNGVAPRLDDAIDNDDWFDDVSDGPVNAVILFDDGSTADVVAGWVVTTDPAYAPQTRNVVSTWDDVYNTWVQELALVPSLYAGGRFNTGYKPSFHDDIMPVFHAAMLQQWNCALPSQAINGHKYVGAITASDTPSKKIPNFQSLIRNPNDEEQNFEGVMMPLSLGDAEKSFLSVSETQYFNLMQWYSNQFSADAIEFGPGEKLDRVVLENGLGGRYSPGIEMTFIVRDVNLYRVDWKSDFGPFRINEKPLDYSKANAATPFLGVGYVPLRTAPVEPGDLSKFMALPWHTDYNSCATHLPDPNKPEGNNTLYWSWPAQRPVQVYPASACSFDSSTNTWNLGGQLFSVRGSEGNGTHTDYPQQVGRYQCYFDFVENWEKVGFIIQGSQISAPQGNNYGADKFVETASLFESDGDLVQPWPTANLPGYTAPKDCGPPTCPAGIKSKS